MMLQSHPIAPPFTWLQSTATSALGCNEFDSVWRTTINPNVAAPLPAVPPLGTYWERVFCHTTSGNCNVAQTDLPILRVVESCTDKKDGEIVGWAAEDANATSIAGPAAYWPGLLTSAITGPSSPPGTRYVTSPSNQAPSSTPSARAAWSRGCRTPAPPGPPTSRAMTRPSAMATPLPQFPTERSWSALAAHAPYPASYSSNAGVTFNVLAWTALQQWQRTCHL